MSEKLWADHPHWNGPFNWISFLFLMCLPIFAVLSCTAHLLCHAFSIWNLVLFFAMAIITGFSVTIGYHRYYSHRTFECHPLLQWFFLIFGAGALENSALEWASNHWYHHRYVDTDSDPYNIKRGFMWAHMGWIFYQDPPGRIYEQMGYILNDPR